MLKQSLKYSVVFIVSFFIAGLALPGRMGFAQESPEAIPCIKELDELLRMSWAASNRGSYAELESISKTVLSSYEREAMGQSASLAAFPARDKADQYKTMNDVAAVLFVLAESLMHQGRNDEAIATFEQLIKDYPYAQSWDASRGSYWSIAEKSRESMDVINGVVSAEVSNIGVATKPALALPGKDKVIDYSRYGSFSGVGTDQYKFAMTNPNVLAKAVGEGIYPNTADVLKNPRYKETFRQGRLGGTHWDFVNTKDLEAAYFKWSTAFDAPGIKLFYTALTFEKSGMLLEAIKAYHALVVHFPRSMGMTYWQTPWYPAQAAVGKIKNILRQNPSLGLEYTGAKVQVINGDDNDPDNDQFIVWPGVIKKASGKGMPRRNLGKPFRSLGGKKTKLVQYQSCDWQMLVNDKPFLIKAITYMPTKVGQSPDKGTIENWMTQDSNNNGRLDSPYDSWVDRNGNNIQDANEPVVGDFQLMKDMGVNAIRLYHHPTAVEKAVLRELYDRYGIMVIMGDFLGKYTIGSGAEWSCGTDYEDAVHQAAMMKSVEGMVNEFKDEPYILMWLLGNENNYGVASNGDKKPDAYYKFANTVARRVKEIDPDRPVAICNGDILFLKKFAENAPDIDIFGANVYRGDYGFASFWDEVRRVADKPAFITEYGAPAYSKRVSLDEAEAEQVSYHRGAWLDIMANSAGVADGEGNSIGGIAFEWMDEWWKNYEPAKHDTKADVIGPFVGGYYFEEWFGIIGQGDGKNSPFLRSLRKTYYMYKGFWRKQ